MKKVINSLGTVALALIFLSASSVTSPNTYYSKNGIIRHDVQQEKYVKLGNQVEFNCVGRYSISEESNDYAVGVLISPNWVLTAAHFVENSSVWKFGDAFYQTKRVIKHPALASETQEAQWNGWDLALVELAEPVWDVKPATRYYGAAELGQTITKVGYGFIGDGKSGLATPRVQKKLAGNNVVDAIGGRFEDRQFSTAVLVCDFDSPENSDFNQFGSAVPLALEIGGSKGDSGGGVFMEENGQLFLVGIVSGALNREINYGSVMALARVSSANEWIDAVLYGKP